MKVLVEVEIEINKKNDKWCSEACHFLEQRFLEEFNETDFSCKLFGLGVGLDVQPHLVHQPFSAGADIFRCVQCMKITDKAQDR